VGRPYTTKEPYNTIPYGSHGSYNVYQEINVKALIVTEYTKEIHAVYTILSKPEIHGEKTIELIYACGTQRYMDMRCLRGPCIPFTDSEDY